MKMVTKIFNDLDGVHVNWEGRAIQLLNLKQSEIIPKLKKGGKLEDLYPNIYEMIENCGEVAFLSSGGNIYRKTNSVANANAGKTRYVAKKFNNIPLILTREKYFCASPQSILIDDTKEKIDKFREYGGFGFEFPHPHKILDGDININKVLGELEKVLIQVQNNQR